jgi:very-short-patch-repair endonuclease
MRGFDVVEEAIHTLAGRQHGLLARWQLLRIGLGEDAIDHRLRTGRLVKVQRGVYALGHAQLRREGNLLAMVLRFGDGAAVSHRSAAALWGIRPWSGAFVEITRRGPGGTVKLRGRLVHRCIELPDDELTIERGVPTTTLARTLLDLAAVVPAHHLRRAVERSDQAELFNLTEVQRVLDAHPGRPGRGPLMALLADFRDHGDMITRSDLEAIMLQICIDQGLPRPQVNRYDGVRESDFRWPTHRLIVEVDSWTFHGRTRTAFDGDRARDRALLHEGWRVARFTDRQILADRVAIARELNSLLGPRTPDDI